MKKVAVLFFLFLLVAVIVPGLAVRGNTVVTFDSLTVSEDGKSLSAHITLTDSFAALHDKLYLFRVTADYDGDLSSLAPAVELTPEGVEMAVSLPYSASDPSLALCGYVLARAENGNYIPLSDIVFPSNYFDFSPHAQEYPTVSSKKGLQVQFSTDAQLLGIKHTVVNAFLNELIANEEDEDALPFVFGEKQYYLSETALSALDYRIRSLTDGGIHIYLNVILAFDSSAPSDLYYPDAKGNTSTLFAPNVSDRDGIFRYAAVMNFLASRYTRPDGAYGFCGSFIIGYEVNQEASRHNTGVDSFSEFASEYAVLLRTADIAVRSAYRNGRIFISLSNRWEVPSDQSQFSVYGGKNLLDALSVLCPDVPYGISINPYPSALTMTDYWNDEKATDEPNSPFITMKNLSVLTDYLKTDAQRYGGNLRRVVVGEFGLSGKPSVSEDLQAAAYLYAYFSVLRNDAVEAMIWHRHVDHAGEMDLFYGLYASSELLLEPTSPKVIHSVFSMIDQDTPATRRLIDSLIPLLPDVTRADLYGSETIPSTRVVCSVTPENSDSGIFGDKRETLFDFSRSLYHFYPTDNAAYLEHRDENENRFLRAKLLPVSSKEFMGIGCSVPDVSLLREATAITLRLRAIAPDTMADLKLLLIGSLSGTEIVLDASAAVPCGDWMEVTFPLVEGFHEKEISSCIMKIWLRSAASTEEDLFLDVESVSLHFARTDGKMAGIFLLLGGAAVLCLLIYLPILTVSLIRRRRIHNN